MEIDLASGSGTAALPSDFDRFYTIIVGFRARNIYGGIYANYTSAVNVYIGDSGVYASSSGNFKGTNARVWVTLMETYA